MLADFFTKPLQGSLFRKFREVVMGHKHIDSLKQTPPTPPQERVGEDKLSEDIRNGVDGLRTDQKPSEPDKRTYADIVRKGRKVSFLKVGEVANAPLTFKK
jgi:hypothetical protein